MRFGEGVFLSVEHVVDDNLFGLIHAFECCKLTSEAVETGYVRELGISLHLFPLLKKKKAVSFSTLIIETNDTQEENTY